ncbi:MAG: hypothetical protein CME70_23715 [Halobacteriovorax sp.]|nr:hypothetical protein [Halobacteriovorax sp.]|tara:strand:- start:93484 stop:94977 length:1494 start_codon:yes stop_codon:yes gene_type:complete
MFIKKTIFSMLALLLAFQAYSTELTGLHLNLLDRADEILEPKENALSLKEVKSLAVDRNHDLRISYERLYQAQKDIWVARSRFFPYGTGVIFGYDVNALFGTFILVELALSLPTKWYHVQSVKAVRDSQRFSVYALRANLKTQVEHLYYTLLKEEALLKSVELELELLENLVAATEVEIEAGLANEDDLEKVERRTLSLRDEYLKFKQLHLYSKSAFNIMLGKTPAQGAQMELQPIGKMLNIEDFQMGTQQMVDAALWRSYEIVAANYMIKAAKKHKKSTQWSILSFSGIGFGYWSRVEIAGSQVDEAVHRRNMTRENLVNQVSVTKELLEDNLEYLEGEKDILESSRNFLERDMERFTAGDAPLRELLETQLRYMDDYRSALMVHYQTLSKKSDMERLVRGSVTKAVYSAAPISFKVKRTKRRVYLTMNDKTVDLNTVSSVRYHFDNRSFGMPSSSKADRKFKVKIKVRKDYGEISGTALVRFKNGELVRRRFTIK